jgi:hypothetical protein
VYVHGTAREADRRDVVAARVAQAARVVVDGVDGGVDALVGHDVVADVEGPRKVVPELPGVGRPRHRRHSQQPERDQDREPSRGSRPRFMRASPSLMAKITPSAPASGTLDLCRDRMRSVSPVAWRRLRATPRLHRRGPLRSLRTGAQRLASFRQLDVRHLPCPVEHALLGAVEAEERVEAFPRNRLDPVALLARGDPR